MSGAHDDDYLTVREACEVFKISRSKFYRDLDNRETGLHAVIIRIPPPDGPIRVPRQAFHDWAQQRRGPRPARSR